MFFLTCHFCVCASLTKTDLGVRLMDFALGEFLLDSILRTQLDYFQILLSKQAWLSGACLELAPALKLQFRPTMGLQGFNCMYNHNITNCLCRSGCKDGSRWIDRCWQTVGREGCFTAISFWVFPSKHALSLSSPNSWQDGPLMTTSSRYSSSEWTFLSYKVWDLDHT